MNNLDDIITPTFNWLKEKNKVAIATVISTWGSAPRQVGGQMAINETGEIMGSVSGGCVENSVITEALDSLKDKFNKLKDLKNNLISDFKKVIIDVESQIDNLSNDSNFNMEEISFDNESDVESEKLEMNLEVDNKGTVNKKVEGQVEEEDVEDPVEQEVEESEEEELIDEKVEGQVEEEDLEDPVDQEVEESEEEDNKDDDDVECTKFEHSSMPGLNMAIDAENNVYNADLQELIGKYNAENDTIDFVDTDEELSEEDISDIDM